MSGYESHESREQDPLRELAPVVRKEKKRQRYQFQVERDLLPYQIVLSGKPIRLDPTEYRFLSLLARRPYHAFSTRQLLKAVNAGDEADITEENLRILVRSLRDKLGFFWDYIQHVPNVGWRFKP